MTGELNLLHIPVSAVWHSTLASSSSIAISGEERRQGLERSMSRSSPATFSATQGPVKPPKPSLKVLTATQNTLKSTGSMLTRSYCHSLRTQNADVDADRRLKDLNLIYSKTVKQDGAEPEHQTTKLIKRRINKPDLRQSALTRTD